MALPMILQLFWAIVITGVVIFGGLYVETYHQKDLNRLLKRYDHYGLTDIGSEEKKRLTTIRDLDLPYEKKEALRNHSVFLGASREMVFLALGKPVNASQVRDPQDMRNRISQMSKKMEEAIDPRMPLIEWTYYFDGDNRPTILTFQHDQMIGARMGATLSTGR